MTQRFDMPIPFGWFTVAYSDDIDRGESKALHYFDRELVIFRGETGTPHVLDAYCPHLGAHLGIGIHDAKGGGRIDGDAIVCPFHNWKFSGQGICVEVPYAKQIPPKIADKPCLQSYHCVEMNGVILVWYHPDNADPLWQPLELEPANSPAWSEFERYEWTLNTHSQEIAENAADSAHFHYVHRTVDIPTADADYDWPNRTGVQRSRMKTPKGIVDGAIHTGARGPGQAYTRFEGIAETFLMVMHTPIDRDRVQVRFAFSQPLREDGTAPKGGVNAAIIRDIVGQMNEDAPIWENKIHRASPILCDGDGPIAKFRKWYGRFYA